MSGSARSWYTISENAAPGRQHAHPPRQFRARRREGAPVLAVFPAGPTGGPGGNGPPRHPGAPATARHAAAPVAAGRPDGLLGVWRLARTARWRWRWWSRAVRCRWSVSAARSLSPRTRSSSSRAVTKAGAAGIVFGRNIWGSRDPTGLLARLHDAVHGDG